MMSILQEMHVMDAWFVTRLRLDQWIVTHLRGSVGVSPGDELPVPQPVVHELVSKLQRAKTRTELAFEASAACADRLPQPEEPLFVGAPLVVRDELYGVLCGLDSRSRIGGERPASPSVMTAARLLSTVLRRELDAEELLRRAERAEADALVDELTGLYNRRAWDRLIEREETRSARYGHGATIIMMDVDGLKSTNDRFGHSAGDAVLRGVAEAVRSAVRDHDVVARLGGDEFAILVVECDNHEVHGLCRRLEEAFSLQGVEVSIGVAHRDFGGGLAAAIERADRAMYERKFAR